MTYKGAIDEVKNLENHPFMPDIFKPSLKKIAETLEMEHQNCIEEPDLTTAYLTDKADRPKWIPVTERLPEDSEWQLVSVMDYGENFSFATPRIARITKDGEWHFSTPMDNEYEYFLKVVAWQPIPEPYRKGE